MVFPVNKSILPLSSHNARLWLHGVILLLVVPVHVPYFVITVKVHQRTPMPLCNQCSTYVLVCTAGRSTGTHNYNIVSYVPWYDTVCTVHYGICTYYEPPTVPGSAQYQWRQAKDMRWTKHHNQSRLLLLL